MVWLSICLELILWCFLAMNCRKWNVLGFWLEYCLALTFCLQKMKWYGVDIVPYCKDLSKESIWSWDSLFILTLSFVQRIGLEFESYFFIFNFVICARFDKRVLIQSLIFIFGSIHLPLMNNVGVHSLNIVCNTDLLVVE